MERRGHAPRHAQRTDVPRNVAVEFAGRQAEVAEGARDAVAGMIDHDDEIRPPVPPHFDERRRFIGSEQSICVSKPVHSGGKSRSRPNSPAP